jgi:hypothetical protein
MTEIPFNALLYHSSAEISNQVKADRRVRDDTETIAKICAFGQNAIACTSFLMYNGNVKLEHCDNISDNRE